MKKQDYWWPDMWFPPINLWSIPKHYTPRSRNTQYKGVLLVSSTHKLKIIRKLINAR